MKNYVIYIRVSTQKQGRSGLGLESQRKICTDFATANGGQVVQEFVDVESGTHRDRKGLAQAIDYCKKNDCPLVIAKLDRLARDVEFCFKVINTGVEIHFCDMPQVNTLLLGVFASVAQYERELTSDRTKKALAVKKAQGCKLGAASEKYQKVRAQKSWVELHTIDMKRGQLKTRRYLNSRDVVAFIKVIRHLYPGVYEGDITTWEDWSRINTKKETRLPILRMMAYMKDFDTSGKVFHGWDFTEIDGTPLQIKLAAFIKNIKVSIVHAKEQQKYLVASEVNI